MENSGKSWNDEFRPRRIADCILPKRIKPVLLRLEQTGVFGGHLLFVGQPGVGKTTVARILLAHPGIVMRTVDLVRGEPKDIKESIAWVRHFMTGGSSFYSAEMNKRRVVFIDEFQVVPTPIQEQIKLWMELDQIEATFLLAINDEAHVLPPVRSRCIRFDFDPKVPEDNDMLLQMAARCREIAGQENAAVEDNDIAKIIEEFFPDMRVIVHELFKLCQAKAA